MKPHIFQILDYTEPLQLDSSAALPTTLLIFPLSSYQNGAIILKVPVFLNKTTHA